MVNKELLKTCPTFPGIYLFKNSVNGKCYVGQAINLKNRLKAHLNNSKAERYDNPLYRAVKKYTWDVFEYSILEVLETNDFTAAKKKLDSLEIEYISQYNGYTEGYNQALGGDGGVLGYKMTPEQIQKIKDNHVEPNAVNCFLYDITSQEYKEFKSITEAARFLECNPTNISRRCSGERKIPIKGFWVGTSKEQIEELLLMDNSGKSQSLYSKEEFLQLLEDNPITCKLDIPKLGMCEKTFYNYLNRYSLDSPFAHKTSVDYYCVVDTQLEEYYKFKNYTTLGEFFGILPVSARKLVASKKDGSLYKKKYKILIVDKWNYFEHVGKCEPTYFWENIETGKILATNCATKETLFRVTNDVNKYKMFYE